MKNIFTAALIATSILCVADAVTPKKAEAKTCMNFDAGRLCNQYQHQNKYGNEVYGMWYYANDGEFFGQVACDGRNYVAHDGVRKGLRSDQVRYVVEEFCALPN